LGYGVVNDGVRQKFTQKERDNETGLDYFLARYYSSVQGRFTSPDEFAGGPDRVGILGSGDSEKQALPYAEITNPQSLNKYQYTYNNPLNFTDSDGHCPTCDDNPAVAGAKFAGQVLKDTGIGGAKGVANAAIAVPNTINTVVNAGMSPFTNANFDTIPYFQGSTPGEKGAMLGVDIALIVEGGISAYRAGTAIVEGSRTAAMTNEMRAGAATETTAETTSATTPYARPAGATTAAQRASVQGKPCTDCGTIAQRMFADHKTPLVKEYYQTGTINKTRMRQLGAVQPQCPTCSGRQGAQLGRYAKEIRQKFFQ
jgi:RHS repeat-associated protein